MLGWLTRRFSQPDPRRWVVVDVETSGLEMKSDVLLAIGAVAVVDGRIVLSDSLDVVLRQEQASSSQNILIHGISGQAQRSGMAPRQACAAFLDFVGTAPLVAYHAAFDRAFLARAIKHYLNLPITNPWLDLAELAPALDSSCEGHALDDWLKHYRIHNLARHSAVGDALATAELLLRLLPRAKDKDFASLQSAASGARWLTGRRR